MISVCIACFEGSRFIEQQLNSILIQLSAEDEVVISDDGSTDDTVAIVQGMNDCRIVWAGIGGRLGVVKNFERAIQRAKGDFIFLADQDDVWLPNKVEVMLACLRDVDLVVSDCVVVNGQLNMLYPSFFSFRNSGSGLIRNLLRNSYLGCCIAFRRRLLNYALPFPCHLPMHDWWLGLVAETFGEVLFIDQPLVMYRRHGKNASPAAERSRVAWTTRICWRVVLVGALLARNFSYDDRVCKRQ
jgi:glycosyltransferase involved in cell wall biosynthesis